ncbi:MAG TPA: hypothetical protein VHH36_09580, partial [Candidatus Thermoplasmatota archaeon]|nr:hypothetical protein [Candidatus Thermoplasmatota archaeon]
FLADDTKRLAFTAWKDFNLQRGSVVKIGNAYAKKGFRDPVDVQLGDYTRVEVVNVQLDVKDEFAPSGGAGAEGGRIATERKVRELRDGMSGAIVTGRILDVRERVVSTANGQKTLAEGEIADETGRVGFTAWEPDRLPPEFKADAVVRLRSVYVRAYRGIPNVNVNQYTTIEILPGNAMPDRTTLMQERPFNLGELESAGGGEAVLVEGVVLGSRRGAASSSAAPRPRRGARATASSRRTSAASTASRRASPTCASRPSSTTATARRRSSRAARPPRRSSARRSRRRRSRRARR